MEEILLSSLESLGVLIPPGVTSIQTLTPNSLFAICSHSLSILDRASSFPKLLPESTADRFKICKDLADEFAALGYVGDISFHKFLYPSEDDLYKLVRFLIEKLSEDVVNKGDFERPKVERLSISESKSGENVTRVVRGEVSIEAPCEGDPLGVLREGASEKAESSHTAKTGYEVDCPREIEKRISSEKTMSKDFDPKQSNEVEDPNVSKMETSKIIRDQHVDQLMLQIDAKRNNIVKLKMQWSTSIEPLEVKRKNLLTSLCVTNPGVHDNYHNLIEVENEIHSIESEITQRREECLKLSADLEKMSTVAPRRSYVQRINDITKNSRKLDADIERIIEETRELQMESNLTQESLHRTYAITSETIFRVANTNPVGLQAHKLLSSIHENFQQISEKILGIDRIKREAAEYEKKLAIMASQSLEVDKLQADLDAVKNENETMKKCSLPSST